jgi:hypothetical protein
MGVNMVQEWVNTWILNISSMGVNMVQECLYCGLGDNPQDYR